MGAELRKAGSSPSAPVGAWEFSCHPHPLPGPDPPLVLPSSSPPFPPALKSLPATWQGNLLARGLSFIMPELMPSANRSWPLHWGWVSSIGIRVPYSTLMTPSASSEIVVLVLHQVGLGCKPKSQEYKQYHNRIQH